MGNPPINNISATALASPQWWQEIALPTSFALLLCLFLFSAGGMLGFWLSRRQRRPSEHPIQADQPQMDPQALISHEVRTPLSAIARLLELTLAEEASGKNPRALLRTAWQATASLQLLLDDLITQSRLDRNELVLHPVPCDLARLMEEIRQIYLPIAQSRQLMLRCETRLQVPIVLIDPLRLKQILHNLLSNAIKYTHHGGMTLLLATETTPTDECRLLVTLHDSGIGMPSALRAALDQPFQPTGEARRQQYGGHGLGLFLCRQLVRRMQGDMNIDSAPGRGTSIQLAFTTAIGGQEQPHGETPAIECLTGLHILLVEDELANRALLERDLVKLGLDVTACGNGMDALHLWRQQTFDILLIDRHLPGINGPTLARYIRRIERHRQGRPHQTLIGMTTGNRLDEHSGSRFDAWLEKPIEPNLLARVLQRCLVSLTPKNPLNLPMLRQLIRGDAAFGKQFLDAAHESIQEDLRALSAARQTHDLIKLAEILHHLQGVTRLMCDELITLRCLTLEQALKETDEQQVSLLLPQVQRDLRALCLALQTCPPTLAETPPAPHQANKS